MNLAFKALRAALVKIAEEKGVKSFRIDHKRNTRGDLVVALIIADREGPFGPDAIPSVAATSERSAGSKR